MDLHMSLYNDFGCFMCKNNDHCDACLGCFAGDMFCPDEEKVNEYIVILEMVKEAREMRVSDYENLGNC